MYLQYALIYDTIMSTTHDYSNNFELFFKNTKLIKFCLNAKMQETHNIYCDNLIYDPNIRKKLTHYFLCRIDSVLDHLCQPNFTPTQLYSLISGYSVTSNSITSLANLSGKIQDTNNYLSDHLVRGMYGAQFIQNMKTYIICTPGLFNVYTIDDKFIEGFCKYIESLISNNPNNSVLQHQLLAAHDIHELLTAININNGIRYHEHASIAIKITESNIESIQFPKKDLQFYLQGMVQK